MNSFGTLFRITLYGESHQKAIGIVIDGMPPGIKVNYQLIEDDLKKENHKTLGQQKG